MTPEQIKIKDQWVAALRSGEYKQAKGQLYLNRAYCCLGVLCELAAKADVIAERKDGKYGHSAFVVPRRVMKWSGLADDSGQSINPISMDPELEKTALSDLNDYGHLTFDQIADVIDYAPDAFFGEK